MITYKQLTLAEIFEDCQNKFDNDKYQFLSLLDEAINLDEIVPVSFISHFYASTGRPRKHQLYPMLKALLIQRIFSIPTDTLLIVFLKYSQELRDFCGFDVVPDGSKFTRFKQDFLSDLQSMFDHLVDLTEPICQNLDPALASMTYGKIYSESLTAFLCKFIKRMYKIILGLQNTDAENKKIYSKKITLDATYIQVTFF